MAGKQPIRVMIVDDVPESRENVAKLLTFESDFEIAGLAGGGAEAIELAARIEPDIVLMDINMPGVDGLTATTQITSKLPNTAVIMMSVENQPDYLRRSMMAGAREFLAKPFSLDELTTSIRQIHELTRSSRRVVAETVTDVAAPDLPARSAQTIAVYSLKGGVGRSTFAANLAIGLRMRHPGSEVALVDGNLIHGDLGLLLDLANGKTILDTMQSTVLQDPDVIIDMMVPHSSGIKVLLAPPNAQAGEGISGAHMGYVLQALKSSFDFIVVDTRPGFDEVTLSILDSADRVLLMLNRELTSIKGAKEYLELGDLLGYPAGKVALVLNRATALGGIPIEEIKASLKGEIIGKLPEDVALLTRSINEGVPIALSSPSTPYMVETMRIADVTSRPPVKISEEEEPKQVRQRGLISRFAKPTARKKAS